MTIATADYQFPTFATVDEVRDAVDGGGNTFFGEKEMRAFRSRLSGNLYGGRFIVTSECAGEGHPRTYTVRMIFAYVDTGKVSLTHIGGQGRFASGPGAHGAARRYGRITDPDDLARLVDPS